MPGILANGFGAVGGSRSAPAILLDTTEGRHALLTLANTDATNWLFAKSADEPGPYLVALPGASITIARGPGNANNLSKVYGFGATPSEGGAANVTVVITASKIA